MDLTFVPADISANLKNVVSKSAAQKALLTLAEKGSLTKKDYGVLENLSWSVPSGQGGTVLIDGSACMRVTLPGKQTIFVVPQQVSSEGWVYARASHPKMS